MIELQLSVQGEYKGQVYHEDLLRIGQFKKYLGDWSPAFRFVAEDVLQAFVAENFASEGGETGIKWQDLAPSTVSGRRGSEHPILQFPGSGALRESFMRGGADHIEEIGKQEMLWGSNKPYALFHQTGTGLGFGEDRFESLGAAKKRNKKNFPQMPSRAIRGRGMARRRILAINKTMTDRILLAMQSRLVQVARQIGYGTVGRAEAAGMGPGEARAIGNEILGFEAG